MSHQVHKCSRHWYLEPGTSGEIRIPYIYHSISESNICRDLSVERDLVNMCVKCLSWCWGYHQSSGPRVVMYEAHEFWILIRSICSFFGQATF